MQRCRQRQCFAKRLPEHQQRQVDRQLQTGTGAGRTDMLNAPTQLLQQWACTQHIGVIATDQAEKFAAARRPNGAADRAINFGSAARGDFCVQCDLRIGPYGTHFDEQLAIERYAQDAGRAAVHTFDRRCVGQNGNDQLALRYQFCGRRHRDCPALPQSLGFLARTVPDTERMPAVKQALSNCRSHATGTENANVHSVS